MRTLNSPLSKWNVLLLAVVLAPWTVWSQTGTPVGAQPELHRLGSGETLAEVAIRYLGGEEFVPELLEFNNITNPTSVREGMLIALPGLIRDQALAGIRHAEAAIEAARQSKAETYAAAEYDRSVQTLASAREARFKAAYAKSQAQADIAAVWAREAVKAANKAANVSRDGRISLVRGDVSVSEDGGGTWRLAQSGMQLPISAVVRTSADSRAEVTLEDGSVLQITESSEISIRQYLEDLRSRDVNIELEVLIGNMLGKIKPKTGKSKMRIKTKQAAIAIRGTTLRARAGRNKAVFTEVLEGRVDVFAGNKTISVGGEYGLVMPPDQPPEPPRPLLPAPVSIQPALSVRTTATQLIEFAWEPVSSASLAQYQLEIAEDDAFTLIVDNQWVNEPHARSALLAEGDYFWRLTAIDDHGLIGIPSEPRSLSVRKNTDIALVFKGDIFEHKGGNTSGPHNQYMAHAAADDTSVTRIEYSLNGSPWLTHDQPLRPVSEGPCEIRMRGVAADGETGLEQTMSVFVDATPPTVSIDVRPPFQNDDGTESVEARLDASDNVELDLVEYRVGSDPFREYQGPFALSAYQDFVIEYRARDRAGNTSPTLALEISGEIAPRGIIQ